MKETKKCPTCNRVKLRSEFYSARDRYDGLRGYCKECTSASQRGKKGYYSEYARKRYLSDPDFKSKRLSDIDYSLLVVKVRHRTRSLINKGDIERKPCVVCADPKTHAHHLSYDKPESCFDVIFLCPAHHKQLHNGLIKI